MEEEDLKKSLTEFFEAKFDRKQIAFECCRLGPKIAKTEEPNKEIKPRAIKVHFDSVWDQRIIYTNRIQNLRQTGIFINEDLSPENAKKSFIARKLRREKKIYNTYTSNGTVYIKSSEYAEPEVFTTELLKKLTGKEDQTEVFLSCTNSENSLREENKKSTTEDESTKKKCNVNNHNNF